MIFKDEIVTWNLKEGVVLPFAPAPNLLKSNKEALLNQGQEQVEASKKELLNKHSTPLAQQEEKSAPCKDKSVDSTSYEHNPLNEKADTKTTIADDLTMLDESASDLIVQKASLNLLKQSFNLSSPQNLNPKPNIDKKEENTSEQQSASLSESKETDSKSSNGDPKTLTNNNEHNSAYLNMQAQAKQSQSMAKAENLNLTNLNTPNVVVDGAEVSGLAPTSALSSRASWRNHPYVLRKLRADVFVDMHSNVDYLNKLVEFLKQKGLDVKAYDDNVCYLPSDILLVDENCLVFQGTVYRLNLGRRYIWNALQSEFKDRLC